MSKGSEKGDGQVKRLFTPGQVDTMKTELAQQSQELINNKTEKAEFLSDINKTIKEINIEIKELTTNIHNGFTWEDPDMFSGLDPEITGPEAD